MKNLIIAFLVISNLSFAQLPFEQSINHQLFTEINKERAKLNLDTLSYNFEMQNTLDQVAIGIKTNFCHCFGDTFVTENLFEVGSVEEVIKELPKRWKNNPARNKEISAISIGISDNENSYYFVIRTFYASSQSQNP